MCGLVGIAGNIPVSYEKAFKQLLYIDGLRGMHSTGIMSINKHTGAWTTLKSATDPHNFMQDEDFGKTMRPLHSVLLGHNRYATKGAVNTKNAHPFVKGHIIGAHNGTLTNQYALPDSQQFEVDSENLYHSIAKIGLEETYSKIQGAWALSWWDDKEDTINFVRNSQRPLNMCYSEDRKTLFWASEAMMLTFILGRNNIKHSPIFSLKEHQHYALKIDGKAKPLNDLATTDLSKKVSVVKKSWTPSSKGKPKYLNEEVEFIVEQVSTNRYRQKYVRGTILEKPYHSVIVYFPQGKHSEIFDKIKMNDYLEGRITSWNTGANEYHVSPHNLKVVYEHKEEDEEKTEYVPCYGGEVRTSEEYLEKIKDGCCGCLDPVKPEDTLTWISSDDFLCADCASQDYYQEFIQ